LLVAVRSSLGPALVCAVLSFLTYDFLFIPPNFSLSIQREEDVLTLLFFLLMAALTGNLAARQRRQLQALRDTQEETTELLDLSRKLTAATDRRAVISAAAQHLDGWSDLQLCLLNRDGQSGWKVETGGPLEFTEAERAAADWAWQHDQPAGAGHRYVAVRALVVVAVVGGRCAAGFARRLCKRRPDLERLSVAGC
jgi:two-component system sensor histidine kinase KdpD